MKFFLKKRAFTFVELVVWTIISSVIFLVVFYFLTSSFSRLLVWSIKTYEASNIIKLTNDISDFIDDGYSNFEILTISWASASNTNKILYMKNIDSERWAVMFSIIDLDTHFAKKDYSYWKNVLWYRVFTKEEAFKIWEDNNLASFKTFPAANLYNGLFFKDFTPTLYNSWELLNIDISFTTLDKALLYWEDFSSISDDKLSISTYNLVY